MNIVPTTRRKQYPIIAMRLMAGDFGDPIVRWNALPAAREN